MSEEEMFADVYSSQYLTTLYNIINQIRAQRQPFCELRILIEGDSECENILNSMVIVDNKNPQFNMDFQKFLGLVTGTSSGHTPGNMP
jgi:hypothetical protein